MKVTGEGRMKESITRRRQAPSIASIGSTCDLNLKIPGTAWGGNGGQLCSEGLAWGPQPCALCSRAGGNTDVGPGGGEGGCLPRLGPWQEG